MVKSITHTHCQRASEVCNSMQLITILPQAVRRAITILHIKEVNVVPSCKMVTNKDMLDREKCLGKTNTETCFKQPLTGQTNGGDAL